MAKRVGKTIHFTKSIKIFLCLFCSISMLTMHCMALQLSPFSDKRVEVEGRVFLPYTKGEVVRKINGPQKPVFDKICSIITAWDSIAPPQGMKVFCSSFDNSFEIYFLPYLFEEGVRFASEGGPNLRIYVNDPLQMFGSPIAPDIFLCPQKTADFNGYPIYRNDHREVTIVYKKKLRPFIPVSQEEYLKALIAKEEQHTPKKSNSDYQTTFREMEQAYQKLLKTDKEAAKDFKQQIDEFRAEADKNGEGTNMLDIVALLKKELSNLTAEERSRQAYYGGPGAIEAYQNASGLVPYGSRENGEALVRANPALINNSAKNQIQLLVISWSIGGSNQNEDKPRFYQEGRDGFHLSDNLMSKLYFCQTIWTNIIQICN